MNRRSTSRRIQVLEFHAIRNDRTHQLRTGSALVLMLFCISVFIIFSAYTINVAKMQSVRVELQAANDASALAAAEAYARLDSVEEAIASAQAVAAMNTVNGQPYQLQPSNFEFGRSEANNSGGFDFRPGETPYTSVRVVGRQEIPLFFNNITGVGSVLPSSESVTRFAGHDICLCIDRSASMAFDYSGVTWKYPGGIGPDQWWLGYYEKPHPTQSRWSGIRKGLDSFFEVLEDNEFTPQVALTTFASDSGIDVPLGDQFSQITSRIDDLSDDPLIGGTNTEAGLSRSIDSLLSSQARSYTAKTIILFSDGRTTVGSDPLGAAQRARDNGIVVHTISLLMANNPDFENIANITGGEKFFVVDEDGLKEAFKELARRVPVVLTK